MVILLCASKYQEIASFFLLHPQIKQLHYVDILQQSGQSWIMTCFLSAASLEKKNIPLVRPVLVVGSIHPSLGVAIASSTRWVAICEASKIPLSIGVPGPLPWNLHSFGARFGMIGVVFVVKCNVNVFVSRRYPHPKIAKTHDSWLQKKSKSAVILCNCEYKLYILVVNEWSGDWYVFSISRIVEYVSRDSLNSFFQHLKI